MVKLVTIEILLLSSAGLLSAQCGDADGSGTVDSADLVVMSNCLVENGILAVSQSRVDADSDGFLDVRDLMLVQLLVAGIVDQRDCPPLAGDLYAVDPIVGNLRYVPAGIFIQGSPSAERGRESDEDQFTHELTLNLAVMETEVTRQMWMDLRVLQPTLLADPTNPVHGSGTTNPVQSITWYETVLFANLLSLQNELTPCYYLDEAMTAPITSTNYMMGHYFCNWLASGFRLPSEGEWEYFCRAGTTGPFSVDEPNYGLGEVWTCYPKPTLSALDSVAWWCGNSGDLSHPVGMLNPNQWNLSDVHGNVMEWCWDRFGQYPEGEVRNYTGSATGNFRVFRMGDWLSNARSCRSADRNSDIISKRGINLGFRLVRTIP